jgi:deoxyribodipyrimidine photo-lyase
LTTQIFTTDINEILEQVAGIDPIKYAKTRNFIDGAVTKLSPYISRGVISTKYILESVLKRGYKLYEIEKFVQELAWRDYYQQVWIAKGNLINEDLKHPQPDVTNYEMSKNIVTAHTGIEGIDDGIKDLIETGYMHNHIRMYTASIACNVAKSHWKVPAQWMYYYLLDADWASNALSWQWTAACFSTKKYYVNQENINKYCYTNQLHTFLDIDYSEFSQLHIPKVLIETTPFNLKTKLPNKSKINIDNTKPTLIYNFYNLDPFWKENIEANRVLLLDPSFFETYPTCNHTIEFIINLSKNIKNSQVYVGTFLELVAEHQLKDIHYKEHPTNKSYTGTSEERDFMTPSVTGFFNSFFSYWKKCSRLLSS